MHLMYYFDENGKRVYTLKVRSPVMATGGFSRCTPLSLSQICLCFLPILSAHVTEKMLGIHWLLTYATIHDNNNNHYHIQIQ